MKFFCPLMIVSTLAAAGPPVITDLTPRGAQKGRPFTLTLVGRELTEIQKVHSTLPAVFTPVTADKPPGAMGEGRYASFLVEPKGDLEVGVYPVRVETADGISNIQLFVVGSFPELSEEESQPGSLPNRNDNTENAQALPTTAVTVTGTLKGPERDFYRLQGKAGERRVIEIEARRAGSAIDPVLRVLDPSGKQIARSEDNALTGLDPRVEVTFPKDGYYYVELHDARFSSQGASFYRLKTGSYAYPKVLYPLGARRGDKVDVDFGLATKTTITAPRQKQAVAWVNTPEGASLPLPFDLGDEPEVSEPVTQAPKVPVTINGRLAKAAEMDAFTLAVKPGDDLVIEVHARELGTSKLMAVLDVTGPDGKRLARSGDEPLPDDFYNVNQSRTAGDPYVAFKVPKGVETIQVSIEDLAKRGGLDYGYRIVARRAANDFSLTHGSPYLNIPAGGTVAVPVSLERKGYMGDVKMRVLNAPPGLTVEGGYIPGQNMNAVQGTRGIIRRGVLFLTAAPGVKLPAMELQVEGVGWLPDGSIITRRAEGLGMNVNVAGATLQGSVDRQRGLNARWLGLELPVAGTRPLPAKLEVKLEKTTRKETGDEFLFRWKWSARGVTVPPNVAIELISAADVRAIEMQQDKKDPSTGTFLLTTTKLTLPGRYDFYVNGTVNVDGQPEVVISRPLSILIEEGIPSAPDSTVSGQ